MGMLGSRKQAVDARSRISMALERLQRAQLRLAMGALIVMIGVTVADVCLRYLLGKPIYGAYDIVESCLVVFVFHGIAAVFLNRRNIVIDLADSVVGHRMTTALIRLSDVLSVVLLSLLVWAMIAPAVQAFQYGDRKLELGLPVYILWIAALAGLLGTILCALGALIGRATTVSRRQSI
jgi:TRAP-type transport system small permease protein